MERQAEPMGSSMRPRVLAHDAAGRGDPLVLVPGGLTGWLSWIPHQQRLSACHRAIRVQPIHNELGSAGQPGDTRYTADVERDSLRLTLDALSIERTDLAGWSGGARALIGFALAHPDRVRTLTLVEPPAFWVLDQVGERYPELDEFNAFVYGLAGTAVSETDLARFLASGGLVDDPADAPNHPAWEQWVPHRAALSWQTEDLADTQHSLDELESITCPVLLTKGTTTQPWQRRVVDVLGEHLPDATVVELEGNHAHHIQRIDGFIEKLEAHLHRDAS